MQKMLIFLQKRGFYVFYIFCKTRLNASVLPVILEHRDRVPYVGASHNDVEPCFLGWPNRTPKFLFCSFFDGFRAHVCKCTF